jgi:D-sedoheptulose 7-phosphate isomerase
MDKTLKFISDTIAESITVKTKMLTGSLGNIEACGLKLAQIAMDGGKILFCGNGGSAADCQHLAAELVVRFRSAVNRRAIPAMSLSVDPSIMTAGGNDIGFDNVFARQVEAYGAKDDALVAVSTSGKSPNVLNAAKEAKAKGMLVIGLLGGDGGEILQYCDDAFVAPSDVTARIQECHIMTGHIWCDIIERALFPELF